MTLAEFAEYFETCTKPGQAILNMISLEFSDTPLAKMVQSPQLVRDIDWVNRCWPDDRKQEGQFPKVQYYCLMSQGGSYTDFHVDFGGTSVWYHILKGEKEFLLIRPTKKNLELYEGWIRSPTQSQVFFGDLADTCYRVVLNEGETLMIPSGWIHAVFTPKPSLVFGGNFLHSLNIPMQLQVHEIEVRAKIHSKFRFPYFKEMMLFAASKFLNALRAEQVMLRKCDARGASVVRKGRASLCLSRSFRGRNNGDASGEKAGAPAADSPAQNNGPATQSDGTRNGAGSCAGVLLGSWERQGLRQLLEACQSWVQAEEEDSDEDHVPEEWHLAATMAGCADVKEMLSELGRRVSALEEVSIGTSAPAVAAAAPSKDATPPATSGTGGDGANSSPAADPTTIGSSGNGVESPETAQQAGPSAAERGGAAALLLAAAAASTLEGDAGGSTEATAPPTTKPGMLIAAADRTDAAVVPDGADGGALGDGSGSHPGPGKRTPPPAPPGSSSSSYSIPKLKLSIKPQQRRPPSSPPPPRASSSAGGAAGGVDGGDSAIGGSGGSPRAGLKLVLKGPALSSPGGAADDTRIGRGGKRKARPLGSRLRAIARLGDDAAAGGTDDDDSADEYKPGADDDVLPGDHKIYADELPRELKRGKSSRGSSGGAGGKVGVPVGAIAGARRMSVTKQEALRSKGVFKIAPQSKVPVKPNGKDKKPLTAKQKLMAKMRR
ncbi:unnamed protein product [Scytosiphon promiscuus]